ncbi:rho GTPase-activating protein 20-like isoform X2 [Mastomys coucha]|nr:rho GTPase-activating protein 20-like isoform X2 [Mastomys coucha]
MCTNPPVPSQSPPPEIKYLFGRPLESICEDRKLPAPIIDMLSIIAEKGEYTDHIFTLLLEKRHWSLKDRINDEQQINWNKESVLIVASVLRDFIQNIQGSLLCSHLFENWLRVLDENSLHRKISAIKRILLKIPQPNYMLLKYLICVLLKIKRSSKNHLDTNCLSVRLASCVMWDQKSSGPICGVNFPKQVSIMGIMIDNCVDIFGDDDVCLKDIQMKSDTAGKSPVTKKTKNGHSGKTCDKKTLKIASVALQEEGPTAEQNGTTATY